MKSELDKSPDVPADMKKQVLKEQPGAPKPGPDSEAGDLSAQSSSTSYAWNTSDIPDGTYVVKVVASDKLSNPTGALTGEAVSEPFVVCNTPPSVTVYRGSGRLTRPGLQ